MDEELMLKMIRNDDDIHMFEGSNEEIKWYELTNGLVSYIYNRILDILCDYK